MDEDGPIYSGARARLVGQLNLTEADVDWLLPEVRNLLKLDALPGRPTFEAIGRRFNALVGRVPHLNQPLTDSSELFEEAAANVYELCERIQQASDEANVIDGSSRAGPSDGSAMQSAARSTAEALERVQKAIRSLVLPYRVKCQLHGLRVGQAVDFEEDYKDELPEIDERIAALTDFSRRSDYFREGVFDVPGQRVWRRSSSAALRALSCLTIPVFAVLVGAALAGAGRGPHRRSRGADPPGAPRGLLPRGQVRRVRPILGEPAHATVLGRAGTAAAPAAVARHVSRGAQQPAARTARRESARARLLRGGAPGEAR